MSKPTDNTNGTPRRRRGDAPADDLAAAWARLMRLQARRLGRPAPTPEQADALLGHLLARPLEEAPTPRKRKRKEDKRHG
jgi:hypothetical protein